MAVASTTLRRPGSGRADGEVLLRAIQGAVEGRDVGRGIPDPVAQKGLDPADLPLSRQEDENRAGLGTQRTQNRVRYLFVDAPGRIPPEINRLHREGPSLGRDHGRIAQKPRHPRPIEGGGHDQKPQVLPKTALRIEGEGKAEIGIQRALVELVEHDPRDILEGRIVEDHAGEDTLRHHLDAGLRSDLRAEPDAQAHRIAHRLTQGLCHPLGRRPGGEAARLEDDELAALGPGFVE